jgi:hypothetical protein
MEPIPKGEEYGRGGSVYGQNEFAGWVQVQGTPVAPVTSSTHEGVYGVL